MLVLKGILMMEIQILIVFSVTINVKPVLIINTIANLVMEIDSTNQNVLAL